MKRLLWIGIIGMASVTMAHPFNPPMGRSVWKEHTTLRKTMASNQAPIHTVTTMSTHYLFNRTSKGTVGCLMMIDIMTDGQRTPSPLHRIPIRFTLNRQGVMTHTQMNPTQLANLPTHLQGIEDRVKTDWNARWEWVTLRQRGEFWTEKTRMKTPDQTPLDVYTIRLVDPQSSSFVVQTWEHTNPNQVVAAFQARYPRFQHPSDFPKLVPLTPAWTVSSNAILVVSPAGMIQREQRWKHMSSTDLGGTITGQLSDYKMVNWQRINGTLQCGDPPPTTPSRHP